MSTANQPSLPTASAISSRSQSWLDRTAIFLAVLCGIHCLATPILLVALPLLANTLWVSEDFHLGMLLLVLPTSLLAAFAGCRRHRDRFVIAFIVAGIVVLVIVTGSELLGLAGAAHGASEAGPVHSPAGSPSIWTGEALLNSLGGLFLVVGHARNFLLCRRHKCDHRCEG